VRVTMHNPDTDGDAGDRDLPARSGGP
jgi:hypothetical protein